MKEKRCEEIVIINGTPTVCNGLLFKGQIVDGVIEVKCHKCKKVIRVTGENKKMVATEN